MPYGRANDEHLHGVAEPPTTARRRGGHARLLAETMGCPSPRLHIRPGPDERLLELGDWFRKVLIAAAPGVHGLDLGQGEPLSDLGGAHEVISIQLSTHGSSRPLALGLMQH